MSLANVLAISHAGTDLVLLGDPQQLDQPMQGTHPEGADQSALSHLLGAQQTISEELGLFLEDTWRLHPDICSFTSELFYEDKLRSRPELGQQQLLAPGPLGGTGLRFLPVSHQGNVNASDEEAACVRDLVHILTTQDTGWVDSAGKKNPIALDDILIIAPYNAQVFSIQARLPGGAGWDCRQVSGPGGACRDLLDGDVDAGGGAAGDGVLIQPEPFECGNVKGALRLCSGGLTGAVHARMPHAAPDAAGQCILPLPRAGGRDKYIDRPAGRCIRVDGNPEDEGESFRPRSESASGDPTGATTRVAPTLFARPCGERMPSIASSSFA